MPGRSGCGLTVGVRGAHVSGSWSRLSGRLGADHLRSGAEALALVSIATAVR